MTAGALHSSPRLKEDLTMVRREAHGKVYWIVKEPREGKYSQFGEVEVELLKLMDGARTPAEISATLEAVHGVLVEPGKVADFAQRLKRLGLVERTPAEEHLMLMERIRARRKVRRSGRTHGSILRLRFSLGDPDRWFGRFVRRFGWFWSPAFAWASVGLFAVYVVLLVANWRIFFDGAMRLYTKSGVGVSDYLLAYGAFLATGFIHEFGHGLTTKRYGGEVHELGGMLLYFSPALYCNTNDAWLFEKRSERLWVTFAGPWIQIVFAALACVALMFMQPGTALYWITFLTVLMGGIAGTLGNLNPLIPLDGYYALSDWLEIPNLRRRAFGYWSWLGRRFMLGLDTPEPEVTPRERRVFMWYGGFAIAYSLLAMIGGLVWLTLLFGRVLGPFVWLAVAALAGRLVWKRRGRIRDIGAMIPVAVRSRWPPDDRLKVAAALGLPALLLLFLAPWTFRAEGTFRVEGAERARVVAGVDGVLDRVAVQGGDSVRAGQIVARLWNPELELQLHRLRRHVATLTLRKAEAEATGAAAPAAAASAALERVVQELALVEARHGRLTVRAPIDGTILAHRLRERVGERLEEGDLVLAIASSGRKARIRLPEREAGRIAIGQPASFKLRPWVGHTYRSRITAVAPAAATGTLEAEAVLPADGPRPSPGMEGVVKIVTGQGTVAGAVARFVRRNVRLDLLI